MEPEQKKGNPIFRYFSTAVAELRKVSWPSRSEAWQKTQVVIVFSLIFAVFLGAVDFLLSNLIQLFL
ncbi:MAG: preprotein translocase subunit SecE [Candidatus Kerfeldbacteria bacterium]|nr:preprotein translocase subunit SecE [Candidatus Kerfeldbacteria bacterium]